MCLHIECVYFELMAQNDMFNLDMQFGVVVTEL